MGGSVVVRTRTLNVKILLLVEYHRNAVSVLSAAKAESKSLTNSIVLSSIFLAFFLTKTNFAYVLIRHIHFTFALQW
jgi:hypothetical protein